MKRRRLRRSMNQKNINHIMVLASLILFSTLCVLSFTASAQLDLRVHNISTGLDYPTIQEAIDAPETSNGDIILVEAGIYYENLVVNKSVSIIGEDKFNTIIDGNHTDDVILISADKVNITSFTIRNSAHSHPYDNCTWIYDGIWIKQANHCNVSNNIIIKNGEGIHLEDSNYNIISSNDCSSNEYYGIQLYSSGTNVLLDNNVSNNNFGIRLRCYSDFNILSRNEVFSNSEYGIKLGYCFNNTLSNNVLSNNEDGIQIVAQSIYNVLSGNSVFSNGVDGIYVGESFENVLSGNNVFSNSQSGIYLRYSVKNRISDNNVSLNSENGIKLFASSYNTLSNNTILSNEEDGILVDTSDGNILSANNVLNNYIGIHNHVSKNNDLTDNTAQNNVRGIQVCCGSTNNRIIGNNVSLNSENGIYLVDTTNNKIFHNEFTDNIDHVFLGGNTHLNKWDNDAEGNYWSDYTGEDLYGDGIGDTPYIIDSDQNIQDNNPLMEPWSPTKIFNITWDETNYEVETASKCTIASLTFIQADKQINFKTTGPNGTSGFCKVTIPKDLLDAPADEWTITINEEIVASEITENKTHTSIYFILTHSTKIVNIKGTNPTDNIPPTANAGQNITIYEDTIVSFNSSASTDNIGIATRVWTFIDESPQTMTEITPRHKFTSPGTYIITLNVTDFRDNWDIDIVTVTVLAVPIWTKWWFWGIILLAPTSFIISYLILKSREGVFGQLQKLTKQYVWDRLTEEGFKEKLKELKERSDVDMRKHIDEILPYIITFERGKRAREEMKMQ